MDYQGNSNKDKEQKEKPPAKDIQRITKGEVIVAKKSLGQKFKDVFIALEIKKVIHYVIYDICIPAAQNTFVDSVSKGVARMTFGERMTRPPGYIPGSTGTRYSYNTPVTRRYTPDNLDRSQLPPMSQINRPSVSQRQQLNTDLIFSSRDEAASVLEAMSNILDQYDVVSVGDLNELCGIHSVPPDQDWGWMDLRDAQIRQAREGFALDLPQPQSLK